MPKRIYILPTVLVLIHVYVFPVFLPTVYGQNPTVRIRVPQNGDVDFQNETHVILTNSYLKYELICEAEFPIQWIFVYDPVNLEFLGL